MLIFKWLVLLIILWIVQCIHALNTDGNTVLNYENSNTTWRRHLPVIKLNWYEVHNFVSHIRVGMSLHPVSSEHHSDLQLWLREETADMEQLHRGQPRHGVYSCCPQVTGLILLAYGCFNATFLNTYSHQTRPVWLRVMSVWTGGFCTKQVQRELTSTPSYTTENATLPRRNHSFEKYQQS